MLMTVNNNHSFKRKVILVSFLSTLVFGFIYTLVPFKNSFHVNSRQNTEYAIQVNLDDIPLEGKLFTNQIAGAVWLLRVNSEVRAFKLSKWNRDYAFKIYDNFETIPCKEMLLENEQLSCQDDRLKDNTLAWNTDGKSQSSISYIPIPDLEIVPVSLLGDTAYISAKALMM